jgi:hypothetical protein
MDLIALVIGGIASVLLVLVVLSRFLAPQAGEGRAAALLERFPRAWRDETFYEDLTTDARTTLTAVGLVAAVGVALMAPLILNDLSAGRSPVERLLGGAIGALVAWLFLGTVAFAIARIAFGRHARWKKTVVALGYALSPLLFAGFWAAPFGLWLVLVGVSASFLLSYLALRSTLPGEPMGTMIAAVSFLVAGLFVWYLHRPPVCSARASRPLAVRPHTRSKGVQNPDGTRAHYAPGSSSYDEVGAERCFGNERGAADAGYPGTPAQGSDCAQAYLVKGAREPDGSRVYAFRGSPQYQEMQPEQCFVHVAGALDAGYQPAPGLPSLGCPQTTPIKGARNQSAQKLYFVPNNPSYERVSAEACFANETQARSAGYQPG